VAAVIKEATSTDVVVAEGARGEFSVRVGDRVVAQKSPLGFPSDNEILALVREALQP
jgi:hypothetical protein